jgi:6-phosphogluconolactonase (cycloisomerase 2 family)
MSKKIGGVVALVGMCALSLFLLNCGSSSSRPSGLLYVLTQGSNGTGNNVSSFAIDLSSGNLSLINSNASTCKPAGGSCGLPLNILLDPKGAVAFVLNQGIPSASTPPTIYAYTVSSDGSLGTPTLAATLTPGDTAVAMTRDAAGSFLFVITAGNQSLVPPLAPQLLVFSVSSTSLTQVSNAASTLTRIPTAISAIAFPAPGGGTKPPCGFTTSEEFLYVTSSQDLSPQHNDNTLSVYCVDSSGNLTDKTPNPPYNPQPNPLSVQAVNTNPAGQNNSGGVFVYVGSQPSVSGALSIFQMCTTVGVAQCAQQDVANVLLKPVGTSPTSVGQNPVGMVVDPTNNFLYVVNELSSNVYGFLIGTTAGTLTPLNPPNLATGSQPVAMAMHSSGKFLYTSNSNQSNVSAFTVSTTSGSMSSLPAVNTPAAPSGMAAR